MSTFFRELTLNNLQSVLNSSLSTASTKTTTVGGGMTTGLGVFEARESAMVGGDHPSEKSRPPPSFRTAIVWSPSATTFVEEW